MNDNNFIMIRFCPQYRMVGGETFGEGTQFNKDNFGASSFVIDDGKIKHQYGGEEFRYVLRKSQVELLSNDGGHVLYISFVDGSTVSFYIKYTDWMIIQMQLLGLVTIYEIIKCDYGTELCIEHSSEYKRIMGIK